MNAIDHWEVWVGGGDVGSEETKGGGGNSQPRVKVLGTSGREGQLDVLGGDNVTS